MSKVYLARMNANNEEENLLNKIKRLFREAGFDNILEKGDLTAIKMHFGEYGNTTFVRPIYIRKIVECIKENQGKVFLTDTNTLYRGYRNNAVTHLENAYKHGFLPYTVDAPVIISDGLTGKDYVEVEINQKNLKTAKIASSAYFAKTMIGVAHFTGHIATGFGGSLKNIGMGFGSRAGKQIMHSDVKPKVTKDKCKACGTCIKYCPVNAITIKETPTPPQDMDGHENRPDSLFSNKIAVINYDLCIGCAECTISCPNSAIKVNWGSTSEKLQEKIVEYTYAVLKDKKGKLGFFNFIMDVTPSCDCPPWSGSNIVNNIGIVASKDIVAIDQASVDLVNQECGNKDICSEINDVDWSIQLEYAEEIGLGNREYGIIKI